MKLWIAGSFDSVHTLRWAHWWHARGHDVTGFAWPAEVGGPHPFPVVPVPPGRGPPGLRALAPIRFYRRRLRQDRPDLVNVQGFSRHALALAVLRPRPLTVVYWGSDVLVGPRRSAAQRRGLRWVTRRADHVYATSQEQIDLLRAWGAPVDHVELRPFGIRQSLIPPRTTVPPEPVILHTRSLEPVYNPHQVIEAVARVRRKVPDVRLWLAGDGSLRPSLGARVHELGLDEHVAFLGRLGEEAVRDRLARARVYVSMSRSDTSSSSLLEALAAGLVPVVSDIPGNRGLVHPDRHGLVVPLDDAAALADALVRALTDDALARQCMATGPARVGAVNGDLDASMPRAEATYERLVMPSRT